MPAKKPLIVKATIEYLAKMFGLPAWDDVEEMNVEYFAEAYRYGMQSGVEDDGLKAEQEAQDEIYRQWHTAVEYAATRLFEMHGLTLQPVAARRGPKTSTPYEYRVVPAKSWADAATKLIETINGVGYFEFGSLKEFLESGPYTAREAVLSHLGWIKDYPRVYGSDSARSLYEHSWR